MKILITGAYGHIGRAAAERLEKAGHTVIPLSRKDADIRDPGALSRVFGRHKPDAVIHLAALVHKRGATAQDYDAVNRAGSETVFRLCAKHRVSKVIFTSTIEVYGANARGTVTEVTGQLPETDYGKSKLAAEQALISIARQAGFGYAVLRLAPVYSPSLRFNVEKRLYLGKSRVAYYFRRGQYSFHFVSLYNVLDFIEAFLSANNASGTYNISDGRPYTALELIALEKAYGRAKFALRLPYSLCYAAIAALDALRGLLGKKGGFFSLYNFRKLFSSVTYDNSRAKAIMGEPRWNVENSFYEEPLLKPR